MTKKHYEAIGAIMQKYAMHPDWIPEKLADYFEIDNPKFNRSKFLEACGIEHVHDFDNYGKCGDCGELKTEF